jgi:hypothetical protein
MLLAVNLTQQMLELIVGIYANQAASTSSGSVIISAHAAMQALVNIATQVPVFFRPNLRMAFSYMLAMANNGDLDTHERGLAVELLVSLAENRPGTQLVGPCLAFLEHIPFSDRNDSQTCQPEQ